MIREIPSPFVFIPTDLHQKSGHLNRLRSIKALSPSPNLREGGRGHGLTPRQLFINLRSGPVKRAVYFYEASTRSCDHFLRPIKRRQPRPFLKTHRGGRGRPTRSCDTSAVRRKRRQREHQLLLAFPLELYSPMMTHTHTHTHTYIYVYMNTI